MNVVDEIKQKTDIVEVIGQYTHLTKSGKTFRGLCPFHSEKHGSFFVYPEQQSWHCFGACGSGGDVFSFIMKKENCDFSEAKKILAERAGIILTLDSPIGKRQKEQSERLYLANKAAADYYHQLLINSSEAAKVRQYLSKRGLSAQSVETFHLGYSPNAWDNLKLYLIERGFSEIELFQAGLISEGENKQHHDRFRHRLMFPIADNKGHIIGFGGRALDENQQPKYLNSADSSLFHKSENLYALHMAKDAIRKQDQTVIVEGYMDVIIAHQYGFTNVVASMGTAITEVHAQNLKKLSRNLVLALDADSAGEEAMLRTLPLENTLDTEIRMAVLPAGKDPDELIIENKENWPKLIKESIPVMDYLFDRITSQFPVNTVRGKKEVVDRLLPQIAQIINSVRRVAYIRKLADIAGVQSKEIELMLRPRHDKIKTRPSSMQNRTETITSRPVEDYCLSLLLQHPELKEQCQKLLPDYFENSENREILHAILTAESPEQQKAILDSALWEHYDKLLQKEFPDNQLSTKLQESILRLREEHLKRLAQHRVDVPATEESDQLRQVFIEKEQLGLQKRRPA